MKKFVFYGKGGIGKSLVALNLGYVWVREKKGSIIIGCSPKANITDPLKNKGVSRPVLDIQRVEAVNGTNIAESFSRYGDLTIVETGGPEPGVGCAGRGIPVALDEIEKQRDNIANYRSAENLIYDVIGDVVCGGFATPMRGTRDEPSVSVVVVTSGELMSLYSANNIIVAAKSLRDSGTSNVQVPGLVANLRGVHREEEIIREFSRMINVPILVTLQRDPKTMKKAEEMGKPVAEAFPESQFAKGIVELAGKLQNPAASEPTPIEDYNRLFDMFMSYQEKKADDTVEVSAFTKRIPKETAKRDKPLKISIYGTGGIGKSTTSSNLSAALVLRGEHVLQIGCDPKRDSVATLCGELKPTIMDQMKTTSSLNYDQMMGLIYEGRDFEGRLQGCECGGPKPGKGCAGKGVHLVLTQIEKTKLIDRNKYTFILYDVLGDTVCGGFALPLQFTNSTYVVTSGELAPMVQAMKIIQSIDAYKKRNPNFDIGVAGVINNMRGVENEEKIVEEVFSTIGIPVIQHIPRSEYVQKSENYKRTVVQTFPESDQTGVYLKLAEKVVNNGAKYLPTREVLSSQEVKAIIAKY